MTEDFLTYESIAYPLFQATPFQQQPFDSPGIIISIFNACQPRVSRTRAFEKSYAIILIPSCL